MKDINQVTLRGHVGSIKTFGQTNNVASISVATTESYQDRSGKWQDTTTWHRVKAFANNRNLPPFDSIEKGMIIQVTGKLASNKFTDKEGNDREMVEIEANDIVIVLDQKADRYQRSTPRNERAHNYEEDF